MYICVALGHVWYISPLVLPIATLWNRVIDEETESRAGCNLLTVRDSNPVFYLLSTNRNQAVLLSFAISCH